MAKVAVITRTKDRPVFLKRALQSVAHQTFTDYEHVVVNDGGDREAVEKVIASLPDAARKRVSVFHRKEASNAPDTIFNESVDRVSSTYVAIHDDDDTWHPTFLEQTVACLEAGSKGVLVRTDKVVEKFNGKKLTTVKVSQHFSDVQSVSLYRQYLDNQLTPIAFIYSRKAYETVGKYDASLPVVGDWEFGIRFLQKYEVEYVDPGFALANYHHRVDKDNSFAQHKHRAYITKVMNEYLRKDLASGTFGAGYIMNSLRYEQDMFATIARRLLPRPIAKLVQKKVR